MKPVTLNLASRPFRNNVLVGTLLTVIGAGLVAATGYNLYVYLGYGSAYARLQQEQTNDRARIVDLQATERQLAEQVRTRDFRRAFERGKLASELVRKSAFSWTQLFNTLEGVVPPDVVTTAIRPNISADAIVIRIEGVAKNSAAFLSFQDRLQRSPLFTKVYPVSERRLNPSLPDISFLLTCNYLLQAAPTPDAVAAAAAAATAAAPTDAATAIVSPQSPEGGAAATGAGAAAHGTQLAQATTTVGRDGLPVSAGNETVVAPGAISTPPGAAAPAAPAKKGGKRRPTPAESGPKTTAPTVKWSGGTAAPGKPLATSGKPAVTPARPGATTAAAPGSAAATEPAGAGTAPRSGAPVRLSADGRVWDPNLPRTMPAQQKAALAAQPKPPERPATATRLDVALSFAAAPAGDVYERLAQAHGVRFEFRSGVDRAAPVTVNLQGRRLEDALLLVAAQTHQRVTRLADGVYQVEGPDSARPFGASPVAEEPIAAEAP